MLEVKNLNMKKKSEDRELIKNLSFTMHEDDKYAIIGVEGSGKSSLLKTLYGDLLDYIEISGHINCKGKIGYLPQFIEKGFEKDNIIDYLLKSKPNDPIQTEDYALLSLLDKTLRSLHYDLETFDESKQVSEFSGGERVKLSLCKVLLRQPDILFLDEPTNDLDLETVLFLEDFIINESRPILYISHDERLLENTSNGIIHLSQVHKFQKAQTFFEKMDYLTYKKARNLALDSQEMIARKQRADYKKKIDRFRQIYQKVEHQQNQAVRNPSLARLLAKKMKSLKSMERRIDKEDFIEIPEREEDINLFFLEQSIPAGRLVLDYKKDVLTIGDIKLSKNIHLLVKGPSKICIIGRNGCGKTTLLKDIADHLQSRDNLKVGLMSQNYDELLDNQTALEYVMKGRISGEEGRIRKMMGALHFTREEMLYQTSNLSGGQKAKLILLKMVLDHVNVLILDEPTRNLSPLSMPTIHNMFLNFKGAIIGVSHDRSFIENVFDDVYKLDKEGLHKLM